MVFQIIWFVLWGVLWSVYFMLDGFVLGTGMLHYLLGKNDGEKRVLINTIGPVWDGNEVWLLTAGGATFAAFPTTYALMFSYLYTALLLLLFALIIRGVSYEFRGKVDNDTWRRGWDTAIVVGNFLPALLFGVAFGNIFAGFPMDAAGYHGSLLTLLNPYGLLTGVLFVLLFAVHGSLYAAVKTRGELSARSAAMATRLWPALLVTAVVFLGYSKFATNLYGNYFSSPFLADRPAPGGSGAARHQVVRGQWPAVAGVYRILPDHRPGGRHRCDRPVPEPDSVEPRSGLQPDHLQFLVQPVHPEDHDSGGIDLCPDRHCL